MASSDVNDRPPVCSMYREDRSCGRGPSSSGGTTVFAILKPLEGFDLSALGKDSPVAWHLIAESMRLAYADREVYQAGADYMDVPVAGLIDPGYLAARARLTSPDSSIPRAPAGHPPGPKPTPATPDAQEPAARQIVG